MISIAKVLETASNFVKVLRYGNKDVSTPLVSLPYGIDSKPIENKRGVVSDTRKKGKNVILGYLLDSDKTESGEIRLYATDDDGVEKFYVHLKKDGTCEIGGDVDNAVRYSKLETAFNELKENFNKLVTTYNSHVHPVPTATALAVPPATGITTITVLQGVQSVADITPAKIKEIKTL